MTAPVLFLNASEAARRLGVSAKALRLYEARGLVSPQRTAAGWRAYGPDEMRRAGEIAALRALGFSLSQVQRVLNGDPEGLEPALAALQARLQDQIGDLATTVDRVRALRNDLAGGRAPSVADLARLAAPAAEPAVAFDLPWPWGGERFELPGLRAITYIVGSLGSGKTRLARRLAEELPDGRFLDLDRNADVGAVTARLAADPALNARVEATLAWLAEEGAAPTDALRVLVVALEDGDGPLVIDMIEDGLDETAQSAVVAHLRRRGPLARPVIAMTRSSDVLDLCAVGPDEAILLCPPNHSPPSLVAPRPGAPGYEAVATCLAPSAVRARTAGLVATRAAGAA